MNTAQIIPLETNDSLDSFVALLTRGAEALHAAGQMLLRLVKSGQTSPEEIIGRYPGKFTPAFLDGLLRIGEGSLRPELVLNPCPAYATLARLSADAQNRALEKPVVDVVVDAETGNVLKQPLTSMAPATVKQVIGHTGIRSRDEQRAWLRTRALSRAQLRAPIAKNAQWIVRKDHVEIIHEHTRLTKQDLLRLLSEIA